MIARFSLLVLVSVALGCTRGDTALAPNGSPTASPPARSSLASTTEVTKPPFSQPPLPAPTYVVWAIDRSDQPDRPYLLELHYDGAAMGFWITDATGRRVLQLPIAGSGIFGPETCMAAVQKDRARTATWRSIDDATMRDISAHTDYRVEVDTIGHGTITLPLAYSGCRRT